MLRKMIYAGAVVIIGASAGFWALTTPKTVSETVLSSLKPGDVENGRTVFFAGGCAACHAAPGAKGEDKLILSGGYEIASPFGTFIAPNISPSTEGIGNWTQAQFFNAMLNGVGAKGEHLYPSFPYTAYTKMKPQDVADLYAFMKTLPRSDNVTAPHQLSFPFNMRRGLGLWKQLYMSSEPVIAFDNPDEQLQRGQYLTESLGHCAECHTPRNIIGGLKKDKWMAGAALPAMGPNGRASVIPNITPSKEGIGDWSSSEIAYSLDSGFTPDFDSLGGSMTAVVANMHELSSADRDAIAAYLKAIPPLPNGYPKRQ